MALTPIGIPARAVKITVLVLVVASTVAGCSGGGSGPGMAQSLPVPVTTPPATKVRFVNGTPDMGTVDFTMGTIHYSVAPRDGSPVFTVTPGPTTVLVSNGVAAGSRALTIPDVPEAYVVSYEGLAGKLDATTILGTASDANPGAALVTYFNDTPGYSPEDFYVVPGGSSVAGMDPTLPNVEGGGRSFSAGTYTFAVTPAGKKTILYQSGPVSLAAGQQMVLLGAAASRYVLAPLPIVLGMNALQPLDDSRPSVTLLPRIDVMTAFDPGLIRPGDDAPSTITIDGDLIAQLPSATAAAGARYHVTPGQRLMSNTGATSEPIVTGLTIDANASYTQRYGWIAEGPFIVGNTWLPPDPKVDYPIPSNSARVRLLLEYGCNFIALVRIDGAAITYANQAPGNEGLVFDRAAGPIKVELFSPDGMTSLGMQTISLDIGHYYVIRSAYIPIFADECVTARGLSHPGFEVSED